MSGETTSHPASMPLQNEGAGAVPDILVIEKPFLTRPRLFAFEGERGNDDPLPIYRQVELLREALRPFAELAELLRSPHGQKAVFSMNFAPGRWRELTIDDFRRAKSVLSETDG